MRTIVLISVLGVPGLSGCAVPWANDCWNQADEVAEALTDATGKPVSELSQWANSTCPREALRDLRHAEAGDPEAQVSLARLYFQPGDTVPSTGDAEQAIEWFERAAEAGNESALTYLVGMFLYGDGVEKDPDQGLAWLHRGVDMGMVDAMQGMALFYEGQGGYTPEPEEALHWWRLTADAGDNCARVRLGLKYGEGWDAPQDIDQAIYWYREALAHGGGCETTAANNLGVFYETGLGLPKDEAEAARLYEQAGNAAAFNLARLFEAGHGVPQDLTRAIGLYQTASLFADEDARGALERLGEPLCNCENNWRSERVLALAREYQPDARPKLTGYPAYYQGISMTEPVTGWTITVEQDGRHVSARDAAGALKWRIDPLEESGVGFYRIPWPTIDYLGVAQEYAQYPNADNTRDSWPFDPPAVSVAYNSSQAFRIDLASAQVHFLGQD